MGTGRAYNPPLFSRALAQVYTRAHMVSLYPMKATVQATVRKTGRKADHKIELSRATQAGAAVVAQPAPGTPVRGRRLQVRKSGVHGKGVFAVQPIRRGEAFIEYIGEVIGWPEALRRHPHDPDQPDHTFYFHLDDERVIDGLVGGNASRWINHSCAPNCEAEDDSGRVWLKALRHIKVGEELFFDYGLVIDERHTAALKKRFECRCGAKTCRGTMLAPKTPETPKTSKTSKTPQSTAAPPARV